MGRAMCKLENLIAVAAQEETAKHVWSRLRRILYNRPTDQTMQGLIDAMGADRDRALLSKAPVQYNGKFMKLDPGGFESGALK